MARPKTKYPKENTLYVRVEPELKEHLQKVARAAGLSVSAWMRMKAVESSGYKPK